MNFKKTLLAAALAGASIASVNAHAIDTVMTVTSGTFGMGFFTGGGFIPVTAFGTGAADITDQYNPAGWDTSAAQTTGVAAPGAIASFAFGTGATDQVNTYTTGGNGFPVFTGALTNGVQSFDFSSFTANWGGTVFNQGNAAVALTLSNCSAAGCDYSMAWNSTIVGGPFNNQVGSWVLGGTIAAAAPVPEASTYGMMIAGLGLVGFVARRRGRNAA